MENTTSISIIIPTYNEEGNIVPLVEKAAESLKHAGITYEIIFVDDHSTDNTQAEIRGLKTKYPITLAFKKGKRGKAFSILEGFSLTRYPVVAMMDADMQYPPEYLPAMMERIRNGDDIVVARRAKRDVGVVRKLASHTFRYVFGQLLFGLNCDVQSGMKVFRREVLERIKLSPTPWTFDLEFLLKALDAGYSIGSLDIPFLHRHAGKSKVSVGKTSLEIAWAALRMKFKIREIIPLAGEGVLGMNGFHFHGRKYMQYTDLKTGDSALTRFSRGQIAVGLVLAVLAVAALLTHWHAAIVAVIAALTAMYFADLLFNMFLVLRSLVREPEVKVSARELKRLDEDSLPLYSIFCPLYREGDVVPQFVSAISRLDYPKEKLQVLLLLEEDDAETVRKVREMSLPSYFQVVVVPDSQPKTKPKACNYGLGIAKGEYSVIYDAEDIPDPQQLRKVVAAFAKADEDVLCVQAKLNFYNPDQNLLTRLFTTEYMLWFDLILTGLHSLEAPIPLAGTSNHFRTADLRAVKGWDAFNVTEDCDLGIRLAKKGFKTAVIDSTTLEEANGNPLSWFNQRTRWIKGYIQTYFVHMREPNRFSGKGRLLRFLEFQMVVGGKVTSLFINPVMWIISAVYFIFRPYVGGFIESFFPPAVFYFGVISMIVGNFMYFYYYMVAAAKKQRYDLIKYAYFIPFYWLFMSAAAWVALYRFIQNPHYWAKTMHGFHLSDRKAAKQATEQVGSSLVDRRLLAYSFKFGKGEA